MASYHLVVSRCDLAEFQLKPVLKCASCANSAIRAKTSTSASQTTFESFEKKKKKVVNILFQMFLIHHSNLFFCDGVIIQTVDHLFDLHWTDLSLICFNSVYARTANMWR